ncbi:MAG: ABC transporter permease [Rhodobiaceae bacterium]|nr:ABC transporter permease [Rhodobiaceae bacterium]
MNKLSTYFSPIIALSIIFIIWELLVNLFSIQLYILPAPTDIFLSLNDNLRELLLATLNTLKITLFAFLIATLIAIGLAIIFSLSKILEISLYPITVIFQVTPVVAIAPLIIIWVGLDNAEMAILILSVIVAFFPVLANTNLGFRSVDKNLKELFLINRASKWQTLMKLNLPYATPYILTGMKTSIGLALIGTVVAEFVAGTGSSAGLSWIIIESGNRLDIAKLFSALILLVLSGIFLFLLMSTIEYSILRRWHQSVKENES